MSIDSFSCLLHKLKQSSPPQFLYLHILEIFISIYMAVSFVSIHIIFNFFNQSLVLLVIGIVSNVPFWYSQNPATRMALVTLNYLVSLPSLTVSPFSIRHQLLSHPHPEDIPQSSEPSPLLAVFASLPLSSFPQERTLTRSHAPQISCLSLFIRALSSSTAWQTVSTWILFFILILNLSTMELVTFPLPNRLLPWPPAFYSLKSWNHYLLILYMRSITTCYQSFFLQNSLMSTPFL